MSNNKLSITKLTLLALLFGMIVGIILHELQPSYLKDIIIINGILLIGSNGFLELMKMLVIPLIFTSIVVGVMSVEDTKRLSKVSRKAIILYLITTAMAVTIALLVANIINPGSGLDTSTLKVKEVFFAERESFSVVLLNSIPGNPIASMAKGEIIPVIIFSVFIGIAISKEGRRVGIVSKFFIEFNSIMTCITDMIMKLSPIGVFCLVTRAFYTLGIVAIIGLIKYIFCVYIILAIYIGVYMLLIYKLVKINPYRFLKKFFNVIILAFSTASSNVTIPISIETLEKRIGVSRKISSITIPLGATINMNGTAIMQGVAVVFASQVFGVELSMIDYITVILTTTLASISTAGIPGVGLILLSMALSSVGLPLETIGLIIGVDRIVDMARTSVNVIGDAICTTIIAVQEKEFEIDVFNKK